MAQNTNQPRPALLRARTRTGQSLSLRQQLAFALYAWTFGSFWLWAITGAAMTRFSQALGLPEWGFGVLATLPFAGTLLQVPAGYLIEKFGKRKQAFLWLCGIGRLMWVVTAMIPWLLPGAQDWWWPTMLLLIFFSWALMQASGPAWMNWMSDVIPRRIRGRYFGVRNQIGQPIGLLTTLGIGYALNQASLVQDTHPDIMIKVTSAILGVAGFVGFLDILCFRFVDDPVKHHEPSPHGLMQMMLKPMKDKAFQRFLVFNFILMLAIGWVGQYIWLYLFDVLGWSDMKANVLLLGVPLILRTVSFVIWGKLIDRLGKKPVMLIVGCLSMADTIGWLVIGGGENQLGHIGIVYVVAGYLLVLVSHTAWPGMELANFNFILDMSGGGRGKDRAGGAAYVAVNSIAVGLGGVLSGLLGALVAGRLSDWRQPLPVMDIELTYHGVLLIGMAALKGVALFWLMGLHEPRAVGTRDAIRYMTTSLYSNVRQAVLMPTRMVGHAARWSYKITPTKTRRK